MLNILLKRKMLGVKIKREIYNRIMYLCQERKKETGGYLGKAAGVICSFEYDIGIEQKNVGMYIPDTQRLDEVISKWNERGISFCGILHTHLNGQESLSNEDKNFIVQIMKCNSGNIRKLYCPIVIPGKKIVFYLAFNTQNNIVIKKVNIKLK